MCFVGWHLTSLPLPFHSELFFPPTLHSTEPWTSQTHSWFSNVAPVPSSGKTLSSDALHFFLCLIQIELCPGQPSAVLTDPSPYTLLIFPLSISLHIVQINEYNYSFCSPCSHSEHIVSSNQAEISVSFMDVTNACILSAILINNYNWLNTVSTDGWLSSSLFNKFTLFYCISLFWGLRHEAKKHEAVSELRMFRLQLSSSCVVLECISLITWCSTIF